MAAFELAGGPALTHGPPPSVEELQTVLRDVVQPALIEALEHLFEITNASFTFTVTQAMQGELPIDADALELDYTEILTMQAGLQAALAALDVATAYILTPNPLDAQGFVDAMTPGSTFLTLASGGTEALGDALERLQSAGTILLTAIDELEAETDDQTDDIIKIDPVCCNELAFGSAQELADARALIQDILDALTAPTVITENEGTVDEFSFTIDASKFFTNPITDLKAKLAPYEVFTAVEDGETVAVARWKELNIDEWTLPDPAFNGILPEMTTTSDLVDTFGEFGTFFFDLSLTGGDYSLITMNGIDCTANFAAGGGLPLCFLGSRLISGGSISLGGGDGQPEVWFTLYVESGDPFDLVGPYVVVDNLDDTYTVNMETVGQFTGALVDLSVTFRDNPGFTHSDQFGRDRGGSSIEFTRFGGREWVFEKHR